MDHKKLVREIISEIFSEQLKPTMKYYAFDWDDNLMYMPTKIYLKDDKGNDISQAVKDKKVDYVFRSNSVYISLL